MPYIVYMILLFVTFQQVLGFVLQALKTSFLGSGHLILVSSSLTLAMKVLLLPLIFREMDLK